MEFPAWTAICRVQTLHTMPMSATSHFDNYMPFPLLQPRRWTAVLALLISALLPFQLQASDKSDAEDAAHTLARPHEKEGFEFRADSWLKDLRPDMGKAIRLQMFKGNDYRFCIAVPPNSGVHLAATVLDFDGKPVGKADATAQGWGIILSYKPKKTGLYVVAIRQTEEGKPHEVPCAVITGWK
ncbi:MAG: hypothetical protein JWO94_3586 [Verrucomicrobiaceae bacterium]|nr:hypothetical protein [Verrucomicrobiaceae bacterium]